MNKTYKLLGVFWDNLKISSEVSYLNDNHFINNIDDDYNLFDLNNIRKVNITDILKIVSENKLKMLINKMKKCDSILIDIDYIPINKNKVLNAFYSRRINQIYNYLSEQMNNTKIYLSYNYFEYLKNNYI